MTTPPTPSRAEQLRSLAATLRRVRWFCALFAAIQFLVYDGPPGVQVPHPVRPWGIAVIAWLLLTSFIARRHAQTDDVRRLERVAAGEVAADAVLVLFLVALLSFDLGAEWGLLNIVVLEAALRLNLRGALTCWAASAVPYVVIQMWATDRYDLPLRWNVMSFRLGMVLTVALVAGGLAQELQRHLQTARRARGEADERSRLLRVAADAGRGLGVLGTAETLDAVVAAAVELGFDAVDVCVLDATAGRWRLERAVNMPDGYVEEGHAADGGVSAMVRREGRTVVIDDYLAWDGALPAIVDAGFTTVIGVPVRVGGEVVATLGVGSRRNRRVSAAELECLELLAAQASAAFDAASRQHEAAGLQQLLVHSAMHDRLTGLPNRDALMARLAVPAEIEGERAVVVCDVDGFKRLNDSLGHQAGDLLLCAVAEQVVQTANGRMVARLGGDEFAVLVERGGVEAASRLARMLLVDFRDALVVEGNRLVTSLSIGLAAEDQRPADGATLLRDAGLAMARAKQSGRGRYEVFDPSLRRRAQDRLAIETDLRAAIDSGDLSVAYQPVVSLETGDIIGVEALARWHHPTRGPISPDEFIPLAEETGLIGQLGQRVLSTACKHGRAWQSLAGSDGLRMSVNVSAVQLRSEHFADTVADTLQVTGFDPELLVLEITESTVMDDVPEVLGAVQRLASLGVRLSIDDLGRGWSSLAYLTRYPLSELKIDRSFVAGVVERPADRGVIRALVGLAHDLGLTVVGEGIEDADQLAALARLGCDAGQGFYLHRPQPASEITELLAAGTSLRVG